MKNFKSAFSLLVAAVMLFAMMPGAMAATATIADATVSVFNADGTADGILAEGKTTDILNDNWYYTHYEGEVLGGKAATAIESNLDKVATFTEKGSGIAWSWESSVSVKRIDLWIHTEGGIKDYEIQTSDDGKTWNETPVKSGTFAAHYDGTLQDKSMTLASYYPIVLENAVETQYIRFVIKSFIDETSSTAYVAEARVYDTNMINFGELGILSTTESKKPNSPYLWGFIASGNGGSISEQNNTSYSHSRDYGAILPRWGSKYEGICADINGTSAPYSLSNEGIWYATSFYRSSVKVNKVGFNISAGAAITGFEVWAAAEGGKSSAWSSDITMPSLTASNGWTKVASIECNMTADSDADNGVLFDIPEAIAANGYLIYIPYGKYTPVEALNEEGTDFLSKGPEITSFEFYSVAENELSSVSKAAANVFDTVTLAENKASLSIGSTFEYGGNTYNVSWESDSEYLDTKTGEIAPHDTAEEITLTAKVSAGNYSYIKEQTMTLPAYENTVVTTAFNSEGANVGIFADGYDESILTDGYYYAAYESNQLADKTPASNLDKVAKFTAINSGIQYSWLTKELVKRLDLWILSHGGIKEYEIQSSDNGSTWNTVHSGKFAQYETALAEDETRASYYPIIFNKPVTTKNLRFVIKSFYDEKGAYIAEAIVRNTNEVNLGQMNFYNIADSDASGNKKGYSPYLWGFGCSITSRGSNNSGITNSKSLGYAWPWGSSSSNSYSLTYITPDTKSETHPESLWYSTGFDRSKVKVNKIGINVHTGSITQFEVYLAVPCGRSEFHNSDEELLTRYSGDYELIATIDCKLTSDSVELFELPKSYEAGAILVKATEYSSDARIKGFEFYSLADYELTPALSDAAAVAKDGIAAGKDVTFSVHSCNYTNDADVFFALYSGTQLIGVDKKDMPLSGVKTHTATYTIPADTTATDLSVKAYMWDGTTLVPLLPSAVTATVPTA